MMLPGFKTSSTIQTEILDAAVRLVFLELESRYKLVSLTKLASISSGGTPLRRNSAFYGGDIPWAKIGDLTAAGKWISSTEETITEEALKNSSAKLFPSGTVLYSMYGSIGKASITTKQLSTNQAILGLVPKNGINPEYLYYCLINARLSLFSDAKGTSQKNINAKMVKELTFPMPPTEIINSVVEFLSAVENNEEMSKLTDLPQFISVQRRIVARIEGLAAKIDEAQKLRRQAAEEAEALLVIALKNMREKLLRNNHPKDRIGNITQVTSGGTPLREVSGYWGGEIPWIKTGELIDGDIHEAEEYITQMGLDNSSAKLFPINTILIALYGQGQTRGRTGRLMIEATTNQACCAILPSPAILEPRFTQYWLRSLYTEMRETSRDGAQPNWNGKMIKNIKMALPRPGEQRRIVAYLDELQAKVDALKKYQAQSGQELDALLPSVLDKAFKGEL